MITKSDLVDEAFAAMGGDPEDLPSDRLLRAATIAQHILDLALVELHERGELRAGDDGVPVIPYDCTYGVRSVRHGRHRNTRFAEAVAGA
jgi:hypothetical protein